MRSERVKKRELRRYSREDTAEKTQLRGQKAEKTQPRR
jgi:hypothetical protein